MFNLKSSTLRIAKSSLALGFVLPICLAPAGFAQGLANDNDDVLTVISLDGAPGAGPAFATDGDPMTFAVAALPAGIEPPVLDLARMSHGGGMRGCPVLEAFDGDNALTDEQYERLHVLKNAMLDKFGPKMAELSSLSRQLRDALGTANIDSKKVNDLRNRISAAKTDLSNIKLDHMIAVADVFTPTQRVELHKAMIKSPMGMMGRRRGYSRGYMGGSGGWGAKSCPAMSGAAKGSDK